MKKIVIHLIPNAHLDPVWLWDAREGLNEGITTCRTILELMEEFPELTFIRGEAAIYQYIEIHDPESFRRIQRMVKAGRWDIVGGNYIQPDTNLPATEPLARQFLHGISYFREKFNKQVTAAWAADSFGHSAGLPEILAAAGIQSFACTRPMPTEFGMESPAFWWEGPGGSRILVWRPTHGWYGCERFDLGPRLDQCLIEAQKLGLGIGACFFGLGNHGGGPSREHLLEIREWQSRHPEVELVYSGLHRLFGELRQRIRPTSANKLPIHRGEMNFCLRGCYVSLAGVKFAYRRAENSILRAESTHALARMAGVGASANPSGLKIAWMDILFNAFHDILPGSCIERAADEQMESLGRALQTYPARSSLMRCWLSAARCRFICQNHPKGFPVPWHFSFGIPTPHHSVEHWSWKPASITGRSCN